MINYTVEQVQPFGIIIRNNGNQNSIAQFTKQEIQDWITQYKIVVFKGYKTLPKQDLALFGQQLGEPLQWPFGAINDLKVKADTENYIFTDHKVPMHWDGAFTGKIPGIILFQCITAPQKEDMGGTTFCDTSKIIKSSSASQLQQWRDISITYTTKKIVHYGGQITQSFLSKHPVTEERVIRYAEPVDDLNPVKLDIKGIQPQTQDEFINEMQQLLYNKAFLYTHRWETGDIVLADNHTLLHGREAFKNPNERYIQRINILNRPNKISLGRSIKNSFTIRRKEFFIAELPIFLIPIFLSVASLNDLLKPSFLIGLAAMSFLFNIGDIINCYADYKLDAIYKSHLSNAVYELGKKNVLIQIILSAVVALLLTVWVSLISGQLYLIPLTIIGGFIGIQYSVGPFKFKSKGVLQLFCLWGIIFFGPMLYTSIITNGFPTVLSLLLFSAFGFHQMGIIMLNTAEDYTEDKNAGLNTIIIALGLHRAMRFAWLLVVISGIFLQAFLVSLFFEYHIPFFLVLIVLVFTFGWLKIVVEYKKILKAIASKNEEDATKELKKNGMKVPEWLKIGAYTTLVVVVFLFFWKIFILV